VLNETFGEKGEDKLAEREGGSYNQNLKLVSAEDS
jgi:hypothetical protein